MKVIIAEKPSLGRTIATAISKSQNINALNNKGYITVGDYIVTYAYGHLLTLQDMDNYFGKDTFNKLGYKAKINTHTTSYIN